MRQVRDSQMGEVATYLEELDLGQDHPVLEIILLRQLEIDGVGLCNVRADDVWN